MNVKQTLLQTSIAALCCWASVGQAQSLLKEWDTPFADPLRTRPTTLKTGTVLPGDSLSLQDVCPMNSALPEMTSLSLAEAVDLALCRNPQIKSAWAAIKVQAAALGEARAAFLPTVSVGLGRLNDRTTYPHTQYPDTFLQSDTSNAGMNWRLFDFGDRTANQRSAQAILNAALANHDAVLQKTLAGVISAYFDVQTAKANWESRQKNEILSEHILETAQRREARNVGAQTDTLQAMTALAKARLDRGRASGALRKAHSVLIYALGLPASTELRFNEDVQDTNHDMQRALHDWLDEAELQHPAIKAARAQLLAAEEKVNATRAEGRPTIDFAANYYRNGRPNQGLSANSTHETMIGVTVTIPIFDGFTHTYKLRGAQAQVEQKQADLEDTEHQILMEIVKTYADATAALDNLEASQLLLSSAENALSSVQRKFDKGVVDILDILNAQAALLDAQQERIRCMAEWRSARLLLLANSGVLGRESFRK